MPLSISFWNSSRLWLSLESFYNAGLTSEEAKAVIENLPDPGGSNAWLSCEPMGINGNWIVNTMANGKFTHQVIVETIGEALQARLNQKNTRLEPVPADPNLPHACS